MDLLEEDKKWLAGIRVEKLSSEKMKERMFGI